MSLKGLGSLFRDLDNWQKKEIKAGRRAMQRSVLTIKKNTLPITPVDTGNLRNSCFTEVLNQLTTIIARIGFTAKYALQVHEINKNYTKGQWKYLETGINLSIDEINKIFKQELS